MDCEKKLQINAKEKCYARFSPDILKRQNP